MNKEIMVSIICNAYNHEKYIRDALDSFLMQKTDFAFEVLIHDDASTDKTADIIREYEAKYPDIIRPIYQTENQYSKGIDIYAAFQDPRVRGRYIALCEGDDYWTDPQKLQKQVDALEKNPQIDMCAHTAKRVKADTKELIDYVMPSKKDTVLSARDVILGKGGYIANNSLLYRKELILNQPEFLKYYPLDYFEHIQGSLRGGILYLSECMSAYRWMSVGSWNSTTLTNAERLTAHKKRVCIALDILDTETNFTMTKTIFTAKVKNVLQIYRVSGTMHQLLRKENREIFMALPLIAKIEILVKTCFPVLYRLRDRNG